MEWVRLQLIGAALDAWATSQGLKSIEQVLIELCTVVVVAVDNDDELRYDDEVLDVLDDHLEGLFKVWKDSVE